MSNDAGLRPLFRQYLPHWHWQAIETGATGRGVPDLNGCYKGVEVWIECKAAKGAKGQRVDVRPEQVAWAEARMRAGGRVFLAVRRKLTGVDELWLLSGSAMRHLINKESLLLLYPLVATVGGPSKWDWTRLGSNSLCS